MGTQVYKPQVYDAIAECLRTFYWYKNELRDFLVRAGVPRNIVGSLPFDENKRTIARQLVNMLAARRQLPRPVPKHDRALPRR